MNRHDLVATLTAFLVAVSLACSSKAFAQGSWTTMAPMSIGASNGSSGVVDDIFYAASGGTVNNCTPLAALQAYDPSTNTWTLKAPMPSPRWKAAGAVLDGVFYTISGQTGCGSSVTTVEAYDPSTNTWSEKASLPSPQVDAGAVAAHGKIYVIGGSNGTELATVEEYDPSTNTWRAKAPMPTARSALLVVEARGLIFAIGGQSGSCVPGIGGACATNEAFDPAKNTWSTATPMPTPRVWPSGNELDGKIYVVGGEGTNGVISSTLAVNEVYDPVHDIWSTASPMPTRRFTAFSGIAQGLLFVAGGANSTGVTNMAVNEAFKAN